MLSKARKWATASMGAPLLRNVEGSFFLGAFLSIGIFMRFLRDMQMLCKQVSLSLHRGPDGEPGGGSFAGIFERKKKYIWVRFLDPEDTKILSLGVIWNFSKGTGLS